MFLISFDIKYSLQLDKQDQGFIKALTYIYRRSKLNLELSFETQSYKPQNKKVIKLFRVLFIFLRLRVINSVKSP